MKTKDSKIASPSISDEDTTPAPENDYNKVPTMDMDFLKEMTSGDEAFKKELCLLFFDSANGNIAKMEKSLADNDNDLWCKASHSLKGASSSIGAFQMSKILKYAQEHSKENLKNKTKIFDDLKVEFAKVVELINNEIYKA